MSSFREHRGELAANHKLANRGVLLPFEAELCNTLGISKDEYFEFLAQAQKTVVPKKGYEHIPEIKNEATTIAIIQLVVGLALTAASALLAPKPRSSSDERVDIKRPDLIGRNRFTPTFAFDSVQELARLGQTVPLVFANQPSVPSNQNPDSFLLTGGVRANTLLTFSMLSSTGGGQRLRAYGVAGFVDAGQRRYFESKPDYEGLAFGDQLVSDFNAGRVAAYFRGNANDGPIQASDRYDLGSNYSYQLDPPQGNANKSFWHPNNSVESIYSGARNPSNEVTFGASNPMPNANYWKLDFRMFILPDSPGGSGTSDRIRSERQKIDAKWPLYGANVKIDGDTVEYELRGVNNEYQSGEFYEVRENVTAEDLKNETQQERLRVFSALNEGDMYLLGNQIGLLIRKQNDITFGPLEGDDVGSKVKCTFRMLDDGGEAGPTIRPNNGSEREDDENDPTYRTHPHWYWDGQNDWSDILMMYNEAVIVNNTACDCTEIGIGSTVWKRFQGSNVNNFPGASLITELEDEDGANFDMGRMDVYVKRYSFFTIQVRKQGSNNWNNTLNNRGYFAVLGDRPVEQFNAIRIYHPKGQYEFRLRPVPSLYAYGMNKSGKKTYLLKAKKGLDKNNDNNVQVLRGYTNNLAGFSVYFEGKELNLGSINVSNKETIKGDINSDGELVGGNVTSLSQTSQQAPASNAWKLNPTSNNPIYYGPTTSTPIEQFDDYCGRYHVLRQVNTTTGTQAIFFYWDGEKVGEVKLDTTGLPNIAIMTVTQGLYDSGHNCNRYPEAGENDSIRYTAILENGKPNWHQKSIYYQDRPNNRPGRANYYYKIKREKSVGNQILAQDYIVETTAINSSGSGLTVSMTHFADGSYTWQIEDEGSGYTDNDEVRFVGNTNQNVDESVPLSSNGNKALSVRVNVAVGDEAVLVGEVEEAPGWWNTGDTVPYNQVTDYFHTPTESGSHHDGPEHRVTYVNELILNPNPQAQGKYSDLASMGFVLNSSKQVTSLNQLSAYYKKGLEIKNFSTYSSKDGVFKASHVFPEIAYFLLTNKATGAGNVISKEQIDEDSFRIAADFCRANDYYWDGVIDERVNIRDFIFEQASFCLLDFTMKGGKFALIPAVPYADSFEIATGETSNDPKPVVAISGLFTDGNIREMKVTTLLPEERQMMEVEILYRQERVNQFPVTRTLNMRLESDPITSAVETFDLTQFCTSRKQAVHFAKYALKVRKLIDHTIQFQTTLSSMANVEPGGYIRVVSEVCHPDRFLNGCITDGGAIQASGEIADRTEIYYWKPSYTGVAAGELILDSSGKAIDRFRGTVFCAVTTVSTDRVYKVDSIALTEEGFVDVTATHMPVKNGNILEIMQGWEGDEDFIINGHEP